MKRSIFKDISYFKSYIKELKTILSENNGIDYLDEMKTKRMKVRNSLYSEQILIASYSLGLPLTEIEKLYKETVISITSGWTEDIVKFKMGKEQRILDQLYVYHHYSILRLLAIGILLNVEIDLIKEVKSFLTKMNIRNKLFDKLISFRIPNHKITSNSYCPTAFNKIEKIAFEDPIDEKKLIKLQKNWYPSLNKNYFLWKDNHLNKGNSFFGYWNFELAAIAKINSLEVRDLHDNIFFPTDMFLGNDIVHEYITPKRFELLLSIDKLISKMGGVRRSTNDILSIRKDLLKGKKVNFDLMENKVIEFMKWIETNYLHEVSKEELKVYFDKIIIELNKLKK